MKLIIDIPEAAYNLLNSDEQIDWLDAETILETVARGTPYEERPTGEWKNCDGEVYCSNCGVECAYDETGYILGRFCCNCGARMRRGGI